MQMRATQHFRRGLLLGMAQQKEIWRNTLKYFWSFWFFESKQMKKGKEKTRKSIYTGVGVKTGRSRVGRPELCA